MPMKKGSVTGCWVQENSLLHPVTATYTLVVLDKPITTNPITTPNININITNGEPVSVILHNDNHTPFYIVIMALVKVVGFDSSRAQQIMWTAHTTGEALVITCMEEEAEKHKKGLETYGLTISIRKLD